MGLMAKHILEGKPMIYYYGQGYMGSLEAMMGSLIFLLRGMKISSIQSAPMAFYLLFLIVNYFLLKRLFGVRVSWMANLLLAISPPALSALSVTALGGYPETLFFGSLVLLGFVLYLESKRNASALFWTGLAAGIGFWTNNLVIMYFFTIGIFWFLQSEFWKKVYPSLNWRKILFLQGMKIPVLVRIAGSVINIFILGYLLRQIVSFFVGDPEISLAGIKIKLASPPFHVKKVKKIILLLAVELGVLSALTLGAKKLWTRVRTAFPLVTGFLAGAAPLILYSLFGGEGYRVIHGSGAVFAKDLPRQFYSVVWNGFVDGVWAVPTKFLTSSLGFQSIHAWAVLILSAGLFLYASLSRRKELGSLFRLRPFNYSYPLFAFILIFFVLMICLFSNLMAARYLIPIYFSSSLIFALTLERIKRWKRTVSWLLLSLLLANHAYANFNYIRILPDWYNIQRGHKSIIGLLESKGIRGGYAHYVTSYVLTFQSQERITVAPYRSPDRYPAYTKYVDQLERVAYVFEETDSFAESFQNILDHHKISYEKLWVEAFSVFLIDRTKKTEKGLV